MIALARERGGADPFSRQDGWDADLAADRLDQRAAGRTQARLRLRHGEMAGLRPVTPPSRSTAALVTRWPIWPGPCGRTTASWRSNRDGNGGPARQRAAGLTLPYRYAAIEGNVTRIKMIKGQMYGRAGFALLRKRVILHPAVTRFTELAPEPGIRAGARKLGKSHFLMATDGLSLLYPGRDARVTRAFDEILSQRGR